MPIPQTTLVGGLIAVALCIGFQTAPASAVTPHSVPPPPAVPLSASAQDLHEAATATFLAANPKPAVLPPSAPAAELAQNRADWYSYLKAVPWDDVFGQWGCTVSDLSVVMSPAGDGASYPTVQDVANCGGVQALTPIAGTLDTKASVLARPANAQLRAQLAAQPLADVLTPLAISSSTYGHVRLGNTTGQSCGLGYFVANGPDATLNSGSINQALVYGVYVNGNWSSRFYNPDFYSGYCANTV